MSRGGAAGTAERHVSRGVHVQRDVYGWPLHERAIRGGSARPFFDTGDHRPPECAAGPAYSVVRATIRDWDRTAALGQPFAVTVAVTQGRAATLRVWLSDGRTAALVTAPDGVTTDRLTLYPVARGVGVWRLTLDAADPCGGTDRSATVRLVTVR